jgi:hypothetical protein
MNNFTPTWLYLKRHNISGLLYFGKTIKDPEKSKNQKCSDDTRQKLKNARAKQTNLGMLNKSHSNETKQKIRDARKLQAPPMLGKIHSEETKLKISQANKGRDLGNRKGAKFTDEHRAKLSIAAKARHAKRRVS